MDNQSISNIFIYILQAVTTSVLVWGIRLQWSMWASVIRLQTLQEVMERRVTKLEKS